MANINILKVFECIVAIMAVTSDQEAENESQQREPNIWGLFYLV